MSKIAVEKNEEDELPIPHAWRPIFREIVHAFVQQDYQLHRPIKNVSPVSADTAKQIKDYVEDYGEELIELPEESWESSIYMFHGDHWQVYIDLYTKSEGRSDLVLHADVRENKDDYLVDIHSLYVP